MSDENARVMAVRTVGKMRYERRERARGVARKAAWRRNTRNTAATGELFFAFTLHRVIHKMIADMLLMMRLLPRQYSHVVRRH